MTVWLSKFSSTKQQPLNKIELNNNEHANTRQSHQKGERQGNTRQEKQRYSKGKRQTSRLSATSDEEKWPACCCCCGYRQCDVAIDCKSDSRGLMLNCIRKSDDAVALIEKGVILS